MHAADIGRELKSLDERWQEFKKVIIQAAEETCGYSKCVENKKMTFWWNEDIKQAIA